MRAWTKSASAPGRDGCVSERVERRFRVLLVDADAALDRDRHRDGGFHRRDAVADEPRLAHQAGPEAPVLHPIGRAADVEVDLVIAEIRADARRGGEVARIGAAELKRHRVLRRVEAEKARARAVDHGAGRHHLGVEPGPAREQAMEEPAMPVRPIHHRRDREADVFGDQGPHGGEITTAVVGCNVAVTDGIGDACM